MREKMAGGDESDDGQFFAFLFSLVGHVVSNRPPFAVNGYGSFQESFAAPAHGTSPAIPLANRRCRVRFPDANCAISSSPRGQGNRMWQTDIDIAALPSPPVGRRGWRA